MAITHQKISALPDAGSTSLIQPSDWNDSHDVDIFVDDETPTGTIDGLNTDFTLSVDPNPDASLRLYINGICQYRTLHYTLSGLTITFINAPIPGDLIRAWYRKA
jgi:hypothetical protein